jgi:hypothetical protein
MENFWPRKCVPKSKISAATFLSDAPDSTLNLEAFPTKEGRPEESSISRQSPARFRNGGRLSDPSNPLSAPISKHGAEDDAQKSGDDLDRSLEYSTDSKTTLVGFLILDAEDSMNLSALMESESDTLPVPLDLSAAGGNELAGGNDMGLTHSSSEDLRDLNTDPILDMLDSMETSVVAAADSSRVDAMDSSGTAAFADHDPDAEDAESVPVPIEPSVPDFMVLGIVAGEPCASLDSDILDSNTMADETAAGAAADTSNHGNESYGM